MGIFGQELVLRQRPTRHPTLLMPLSEMPLSELPLSELPCLTLP